MLIEREMGEKVPVSIGTALAIENLIVPDSYKESGLNPPNALYINLRTMVRNIVHCAVEASNLNHDDIAADVVEELIVIAMAIGNTTLGVPIKLVPYINDYRGLSKAFPSAKLKQPTTEKQIEYANLEQRTIEALPNHTAAVDEPFVDAIIAGNVLVQGDQEAAAIITHLPVDLLSRYQFASLFLLESHTGTMKAPREWNTKLTSGKQHRRIPFNHFTLQLFGDNSNQFKGYSLSYKQAILDLAKKCEWNATTTLDKINADIYKLVDIRPAIMDTIKDLLLKRSLT